MMTYIAHVSTNFWCSRRIITPAHQAHKAFMKPSQLPGEYTAQLLPLQCIGLIKHNNQLCPHRYPFTPGWREAIMVKRLAQGHKHHGRGRDSNPQSDDSAIRTQIRWTQPLGHGTAILSVSWCICEGATTYFNIEVQCVTWQNYNENIPLCYR